MHKKFQGGIGHRSILMWIKVLYFKRYVLKKFGKVKIFKSHTVFELITYVSSEPSDPIRYAVSN